MASNATHPPDEVEELLSALSNRRPRAVCRYFRSAATDSATIDDLAASVCDHHEPDSGEDRVTLHLHHATLPKLSAAGVVHYDTPQQTVRSDRSELVENWFDSVLETNHVAV